MFYIIEEQLNYKYKYNKLSLTNNYALSFRSKPLTLYVFSSDQEMQNLFMKQTSSGSFCVNDTVSHYAGNNNQLKSQIKIFVSSF